MENDEAAENRRTTMDGRKPVAGKKPDEFVQRLDEGWCWMVVLSGFFVHWMTSGLIRSYGAIHVEVMQTFDGSTEAEASWIPAIMTFLAIGLAPVAGALSQVYSCHGVAFVGGLLCCLGLSLSYFATRLFHLYVTIGVMTGTGLALSLMTSIIALNLHFEKRRALAMGCSLMGASVGSFTIPWLVKSLSTSYGFQGAMLIIGGLVGNLCACSLLYIPNGKWTAGPDTQPWTSIRSVEIDTIDGRNETSRRDPTRRQRVGEPATEGTSLLRNINRSLANCSGILPAVKLMAALAKIEKSLKKIKENLKNVGLLANDHRRSDRKAAAAAAAATFLVDCFNFNLFRKLSFTLTIVCSMSIGAVYPHALNSIPAHAMTLGIAKGDAFMLLSVSSIVDIVNRPVYGYVTDMEIVKRPRMLALSCLAIAIGSICVPLFTSYSALAICATTISTGIGTTFTLLPVILADNHGVELLHSTYGIMRLFQGVSILIMGPLTGAIKDTSGHYDACFYVMGIIVLGGGVAILGVE